MPKKESKGIRTILLASFSFAGFNIGSGFATGIEAQQFFASWGSPGGFIGVLVALLTAIAVFVPVYLTGFNKKNDNEYNVYHYYCGEKFGTFVDWYMYGCFFMVILTMMAGAGATINQYFGIPKVVGVTVLSIMCIVAALLGLEKLIHVLSYASVIIILFVICCAIYLKFGKGISLYAPIEKVAPYVESGNIKRISIFGQSSPFICGLASVALLVVSSLPWVASTGARCENKKTAITSGILSGVVFYAAQAVVVYLNLVNIDVTAVAEVPVLAVFQQYLPSLAMIYSCLIILAIFSTISGRLFLLADRFDGGNRKRHIAITIIVIAIDAILGIFIPFSVISNIMFIISSYLGIVIIILILFRTVFRGRKNTPSHDSVKNYNRDKQ